MSSILVVEDDRSTRQLLTEMLKTAGFSVASAKDGVDALKRLRAGSYDLMLLDVWMPKMNGLNVLAALPKEGAGGHSVRHEPSATAINASGAIVGSYVDPEQTTGVEFALRGFLLRF
jgi:CheY-like chemotaxis protein